MVGYVCSEVPMCLKTEMKGFPQLTSVSLLFFAVLFLLQTCKDFTTEVGQMNPIFVFYDPSLQTCNASMIN